MNVAKGPFKTGGMKALAEAIADAVKARDVRGYIETDRAFTGIRFARGNPRLTKMIMELRDNMRLFSLGNRNSGREQRQRASVKETRRTHQSRRER